MGEEMSIAQLGHHIGLHVYVNVVGQKIGDELVAEERWLRGVVVGLGGDSSYLTIQLDPQQGVPERRGLFGSKRTLIQTDDPARVRPLELTDVHPDGVPPEIAELVRAGKTLQAIKRYRELNGATLDEARAAIAKL
jgi:hypothetical protein